MKDACNSVELAKQFEVININGNKGYVTYLASHFGDSKMVSLLHNNRRYNFSQDFDQTSPSYILDQLIATIKMF